MRNTPQHPNPYRCGTCRQPGHDRRNCPCTAVEATRLREEYNRQRRQEAARRRQELNERQREINERIRVSDAEWRAGMYAEVVDMQRRLEELTGNGPPQQPPRNVPTVREQKIQEILFDNAQKIPDGLYKELMDALVIRG
tara:strand:+ start:1115 stop:1534 length:420 start_codon:yes stop_codon:yes gene_type:complete